MKNEAASERDAGVTARRRVLLALPAGLVVQGCGGGGSAAAAAAPAVASPPPSGVGGVAAITSWASRPAAAASPGQAIMITDVGVNGSVWISNGSDWVSLASPLTLAHKFSNARMDGSVGARTDVLLDSTTIPAYVLRPISALRITAAYSFPGAGSGNKAPQIKAWFGSGSYATSYVALLDTRDQFTTQKSFLLAVTLQNLGSLSLNQVRPNDYAGGASGNAWAQVGIDFSQDVTIGLGALNNAATADPGDVQRLEWFTIELVA